MILRVARSLSIRGQPILLHQIRRHRSTAATSALTGWLDQLPRTKVHAADSVALSHVQSLVSTLEMPEQGSALDWKRGDALPPGWTLILFNPALTPTSALTPVDATERTALQPPADSGLDERMWVAGSFEFGSEPLRIGQEVTSEASVVSVKDRVGKDGRRGYYVEQRREIRPTGAATASVTETRTHLYRPTLSSPPSPHSQPRHSSSPRPSDWSFSFLPTDVHLFRFSALTFNTHRIHWDLRYCQEVEKREGLIVHGPLTALMLLTRFHLELPTGRRVESFKYRATSPLVVGKRIEFKGKWDTGQSHCEMWVKGEDGTVYMQGSGFAREA